MEEMLTIEKEIEEESSFLSKVVVAKNYDWINNECLVAVVKVNNCDFCDNLSEIDVCGKTILDWVLLATNGPKQVVLDDLSDFEIIEELKKCVGDKKYVFLAYSDTPFLQRSTVCKIMDYFTTANLNALSLERGYVFKTEYLRNITELGSYVKKSFNLEEFARVSNHATFMNFYDFIAAKIRNFHKNNGVILFGEETIFIDSDVEIESGVVIYPNNIIKGQTIIGKNVVLNSGNIIENSIICDDCKLSMSCVVGSKISKGKTIEPMSKIMDEEV